MFIPDTKNVNVFVAEELEKPFTGNVFRVMRPPLIRQIRAVLQPV